MSLRRTRTRRTDTIVVSSSSDTSEASEDSTPESNPDSPSRHSAFAAENNMSERQTRKLKAGSFGMFNSPTLMPKASPRTPESGRKRKRVKEYSEYRESPRTRRKKESTGRQTVTELSDEGEGEQSLFVPETTPFTDAVVVDDEAESEEYLYSGMTPERAKHAKEYINTIQSVQSADKRLKNAETKLSAMTTEHKGLEWKLATIDATAESRISDIMRQRDEAIRIATEHAEEEVKRVRERLPAKKDEYERSLKNVAGRKKEMEERVAELTADLEAAKARQGDLEREGGFELCSDVRKVQDGQRRSAQG
ncbi:hypothetical protein N0V86_004994 [Didymella sp. IMI 355093]|nr:hypothetical protein N0V86_004994 [Didymella sp. IMI 355093]